MARVGRSLPIRAHLPKKLVATGGALTGINRFALTGVWSDTGTWAASSGGAGGETVPDGTTDVYFDSASGTVTLDGNKSINSLSVAGADGGTGRLYIASDTRGTRRTITLAYTGQSVTNVDLEDIGISPSVDYSASIVGDCGGNSGVTLTSPITAYRKTGASANFSAAEWFTTSGGSTPCRVPLTQDAAKFDANAITAGSVTITQDMPRVGAIDFTGVTNSPTLTMGVDTTFYGSVTLVSGMTFNKPSVIKFVTRSSLSITSGSKTFVGCNLYFDSPGGTVTIADAFENGISGGGTTAYLVSGGLVINNVNANFSHFNASDSTSNARSLTLGSGIISVDFSVGSVWTIGADVTLTSTGSTVKFTNAAGFSSTLSIDGGGKTYNIFWFARGADTSVISITGDNTFAQFKDTGTAAHTISWDVGSTNTFTLFTVSGSSGNVVTLDSANSSSTYSFVKAGGGTVSMDYMSFQHCVATPSNTWYAGTHSTNNQAVNVAGSGVIFTAAPAGPANLKTWNGLAKASVKTINGLSLASMTKLNGLA